MPYNQQGGRLAAASVEPGMLDGELTLELVPGLLEGAVLAADPVVLLEPDMALFNFTAPLESLQCVAADTPDGLGDAPGVLVAGGEDLVGGGELVWAPATTTVDSSTSAAPNSLFDMSYSPEVAVAHPERTRIARPVITGAVASGCKQYRKSCRGLSSGSA